MHKRLSNSTPSQREQWLALLENQGVGRAKALSVVEVPGGLVQATIGEPPGRISLDGAPGSVLMFNISPVQGLRRRRQSFNGPVATAVGSHRIRRIERGAHEIKYRPQRLHKVKYFQELLTT